MRLFIFVLGICFSIGFGPLQAQNSYQVQAMDTIISISSRSTVGKVQKVTTSTISYIISGKTAVTEVPRRQIHKVLYANGQSEIFNPLAVELVDENDWKTIILSDDENDVTGLYELGKVDGQSSPQSRTAKSARNSAEIRLKKKAVNMGGVIVLITKREAKGGYNEVPTHFVEGVAYGYEPPSEPGQ